VSVCLNVPNMKGNYADFFTVLREWYIIKHLKIMCYWYWLILLLKFIKWHIDLLSRTEHGVHTSAPRKCFIARQFGGINCFFTWHSTSYISFSEVCVVLLCYSIAWAIFLLSSYITCCLMCTKPLSPWVLWNKHFLKLLKISTIFAPFSENSHIKSYVAFLTIFFIKTQSNDHEWVDL